MCVCVRVNIHTHTAAAYIYIYIYIYIYTAAAGVLRCAAHGSVPAASSAHHETSAGVARWLLGALAQPLAHSRRFALRRRRVVSNHLTIGCLLKNKNTNEEM